MEEAVLAKELKVFRKQFKKDHGREPSRKDMNKFPGVAATYDAWLALKSTRSVATSTSASGTSRASASSSDRTYKRKALPDSPKSFPKSREERERREDREGTAMGPPPTTPSKKKKNVTYQAPFLTPTKRDKRASQSPNSQSVHDSGGSIVDVPLTPEQGTGSPSLDRKRHQDYREQLQQSRAPPSPRWRTYEDGSSPSKLRALLSSFSSIHKTPTKRKNEEDKDGSAVQVDRLSQVSTEKSYPAYTPRTKARKRLRGEVVVTPERSGGAGLRGVDHTRIGGQSNCSGQEQQLPKKRRGMAAATTLGDYGIVPVADSRRKDTAGLQSGTHTDLSIRPAEGQTNAQNTHFDEDEEDAMLGPSPSINRVVDRQIKAFKPLFSVEADETFTDGEIEEEEEEEEDLEAVNQVEPASVLQIPRLTASSKANDYDGQGEESEDDEVIIKPYRRYDRQIRGAAFSALDFDSDDDDGGIEGDFYGIDVNLAAERGFDSEEGEDNDDDDNEPPIFDNLSLHSPQCKKARQSMRIKAEREVRHLLGAEDEIQALDWDEEAAKREAESGSAAVPPPKTNKVGPPIKGGKLRKGFRDVKSEVGSGKAKKEVAPKEKPKSLIFQNTRDQVGSDQDSDVGQGSANDDEWASDVSSAEYGLGNGYMSDNDDAM
ncbi:hypothetical protein CBS101457_000316 [Exobasidium rhododendri]|nr:hypothetical protein CBS101457_000316 [Exobasidium rhododendri]